MDYWVFLNAGIYVILPSFKKTGEKNAMFFQIIHRRQRKQLKHFPKVSKAIYIFKSSWINTNIFLGVLVSTFYANK